MRSQIYHAPIGEGRGRIWVRLEQLMDEDDDIGASYIIKAIIALLLFAAVFAGILCMTNPPA